MGTFSVGAGSIPDLPVEELSYQKKRLRNQKKRKKLQEGGLSTQNSFAALGAEGKKKDDESESGDDADVVEKNAVPGLLVVVRGSAAQVAYGVRRTVSSRLPRRKTGFWAPMRLPRRAGRSLAALPISIVVVFMIRRRRLRKLRVLQKLILTGSRHWRSSWMKK